MIPDRKEDAMKRFLFRKALPAVVAILASWLLSLPCPQAASSEPVKIGLITDLTGAAYVNARDSVDGGKLAVDRINKEGPQVQFTS